MADITMCTNNLCPMSNDCYRSKAIPNHHWQSYSFFDFNVGLNGPICAHKLPIHNRENLNDSNNK